MHATSYETWMESVSDETAYANELVLYSLCKLYDRHAMVYCQGRNWSTIDPTNPMDTAELHDACQIHLVYLSLGIFGELKRRPFVTPNREFRMANKIKTVQSEQLDSATPPPINLSKDDSVKSVVSTQSSANDIKEDKTVKADKPVVISSHQTLPNLGLQSHINRWLSLLAQCRVQQNMRMYPN